MKFIGFLLIGIGLLVCQITAAQSPPPLNANNWNFVLVPAFEHDASSNNLTVTGLNHALRFGQQLNNLLAGKQNQVRQVYALSEDHQDMTPVESIEPYALLNNLGVKTQTLNHGDAASYNSPAYFILQIVANHPAGTYIMALPNDMLQPMVKALGGSSCKLPGVGQYWVASGQSLPFSGAVFDDQIPTQHSYPSIPLPNRSACTQNHVEFTLPAPAGLQPYLARKVYLVRHVEAHPSGNFENGNYVCQGQWRALGANHILLEIMHNTLPDAVLTSNPGNIIDGGAAYSYIRPALTVAPFAIQSRLPLTLAPFQWEDAEDLAQALFNSQSPYLAQLKGDSSILVGWEHDHIQKAVHYLLETMYQNPAAAKALPNWGFDDYDTVWELSTDQTGALKFQNTCEGIATVQLPSTCPAFFE